MKDYECSIEQVNKWIHRDLLILSPLILFIAYITVERQGQIKETERRVGITYQYLLIKAEEKAEYS